MSEQSSYKGNLENIDSSIKSLIYTLNELSYEEEGIEEQINSQTTSFMYEAEEELTMAIDSVEDEETQSELKKAMSTVEEIVSARDYDITSLIDSLESLSKQINRI